jgi:hypothetical protein
MGVRYFTFLPSIAHSAAPQLQPEGARTQQVAACLEFARSEEGLLPRRCRARPDGDRRQPRPRRRVDIRRIQPGGGREGGPCGARGNRRQPCSAVLIEVDDGPDRSISTAASISQSPPRTASNPAARASMAAATGCASAPSHSASTACAATSRISPSPSGRTLSGCESARVSWALPQTGPEARPGVR